MRVVQVAFAVESDALAMTVPDLVIFQNCSDLESNRGSSFQQDESHLLEASAALSSVFETSVMFPPNCPLDSTLIHRLHFDLAQIGNDCS